RRRSLALGQAVDLVVHDDQRDVHVTDNRVHEVLHADRVRVAVTAEVQDVQAGVRDGHADRHGQRAPVLTLVGVHTQHVRLLAGAPDAGEREDVLQRHAAFVHQAQDDLLDGGVNAVVTAAYAPPRAFTRNV